MEMDTRKDGIVTDDEFEGLGDARPHAAALILLICETLGAHAIPLPSAQTETEICARPLEDRWVGVTPTTRTRSEASE